MKVVDYANFSIYIYPSDHLPPHCHIIFSDSSVVCVSLPLIEPLYGATISREIREIVKEDVDLLVYTWEILNPPKPKRSKRNEKKKKINKTKKKK